jgi:site-specific DNA-methyltransferase (adenine-specific)
MVENVLQHNVGPLNIDGTRIGNEERFNPATHSPNAFGGFENCQGSGSKVIGRWPANLILDEQAANDIGDSARFFYCAKASKQDRGTDNNHPTVKPRTLTTYLAKLILPPGKGRILVPFAGSGSEMIGAILAGWDEVIGVEMNAEYVEVAKKRLKKIA